MVEYAIYKGDTFLFIGTVDECAERLNIKPTSVKFMTTPTGKKRFENRDDKSTAMTAVKLEGGEEEWRK
ncbi:hypothetical protein JNUCC83_05455 [Vagococcus sp. JNUCC 83]